MTRNQGGFALLDLIFVCGIIGILASIAMPRFTMAKSAAGAASAIGSMRVVNSGQLTYALSCGGGFYAPNLTTLGRPPAGSIAGFIGPELGTADSVSKGGYIVQIAAVPFAGAPASCNGVAAGRSGKGYKAGADPADGQNPRHFAINADGTIYEDTASLYAAMPEQGAPAAGHPFR